MARNRPHPPRKHTAEAVAEMLELALHGSTEEAAARLGLTARAVRATFERHQISLRAERGQARMLSNRATTEGAGFALLTPNKETHPAAGRALAALDGGACCWPIGDTTAADFGFCGARRVLGFPYCAEHMAAAAFKKKQAA